MQQGRKKAPLPLKLQHGRAAPGGAALLDCKGHATFKGKSERPFKD
jgi:hypothetical protein